MHERHGLAVTVRKLLRKTIESFLTLLHFVIVSGPIVKGLSVRLLKGLGTRGVSTLACESIFHRETSSIVLAVFVSVHVFLLVFLHFVYFV